MQLLLTSPWVPIEWIKVHGFAPRGFWSAATDAPGALAEGVCPFARAAWHWRDVHPDVPIVFTTACDQMRRAADAIAPERASRSFLFNLPATWQTPAARRLYRAEVERLGRFLQDLGGRTPTAETLSDAMLNEDRRRIEFARYVERSSGRQCAEALACFFNNASLPAQTAASGNSNVALAFIGGPLCAAQWPLFDAIESAGGCVVLNATEPGERCLLPPLADGFASCAHSLGELLTVLCEHYLAHLADVFQRPNSPLYAWLGPRLARRDVRGIVLWTYVGCDLWRAEAASLREAFGLPVLALDSPVLRAGGCREQNRLAAFVESLR
jgi:benzoyl-CoA reductase/2-hydroxyglutaryl-CoA dehydratase subunit BcrC/BadD/HgdB